MWLNKLKSAVVMKDVQRVSTLLEEQPEHLTDDEISQAIYLLDEAKKIAIDLRDETAHNMLQVKKNLNFLNSTQATQKRNRLNITS